MDMPNFKDILSKLSVFKNNIPLLMSVIISLVAILLLIPTQLMSKSLREKINKESVSTGKRVKDEIENAVSGDSLEIERKRQEAHAEDANNIALLAEQGTKRKLLSYNIFLDPNSISSTLVFQQFGQQYRGAMDKLLASINAGSPPTEVEIQKRLSDSAVRSSMRQGLGGRGMMDGGMLSEAPTRPVMPPQMGPYTRGGMGGFGRGIGMPYGDGMPGRAYGGARGYNELERMIVDEVCLERAKSISVYVNPADLSGYEFWGQYKYDVDIKKAVSDCWYYQLGYWVIEDIIKSINAMNSRYDNVLDAPVKQLIQTSFSAGFGGAGGGGMSAYGGMGGGRGGRQSRTARNLNDKPSYVINNKQGLAQAHTGRISGKNKKGRESDIDVIQFNFTVLINIKDVLPFMEELCKAKEHKFRGFSGKEPEQTFKHNQITVLESKYLSSQNDPYSTYRYGDDTLAELDLTCEYIFNKNAYDEIKPASVKEELAAEEDTRRRR